MEQIYLSGAAGLKLAADVAGRAGNPPVVMLHGGGQTRHSWGELMYALAGNGYWAMTVDMRGHGESDWCPDGDYSLDCFVEDVRCILSELQQPAVVVGASLGGISALLAVGEVSSLPIRGLVLVDIVPRLEPEGVQRVHQFMSAHLGGFDSYEEVVEVVDAYMPHRKAKPRSTDGLRKNLRVGKDGRLYWHWDPAFVKGPRTPGSVRNVERLRRAARQIEVPTLLVRGKMSDVVSEEGVRDFLQLIPGARAVDVSGAGHMVSGDQNDVFNDAILSFLAEISAADRGGNTA